MSGSISQGLPGVLTRSGDLTSRWICGTLALLFLTSSAPATDPRETSSKQGPWGEIRFSSLFIEPPASQLPDVSRINTQTRWFFKDVSTNQISELLALAGIDSSKIDQLLRSAEHNAAENSFVLFPPDGVVVGLTPQSRRNLYDKLAQWSQNESQFKPFRIQAAHVSEWMDKAGVSAETKDLVAKLLYPHGPFLLFADSPAAFKAAGSTDERKSMLQMMNRQESVLPKLLVKSTDNVDNLVAYWGAKDRENEVRPLIESVARSGGGEICIGMLLPPFARDRLFRYQDEGSPRFEDCLWTSVNFFENTASEAIQDSAAASQELAQRYEPVQSDYRFGDIVVLRAVRDGSVIHGCNYVADDIVFTKNGGNKFKPWVFMRLQDVVDYYSVNGPVQLAAFRLKR
jgi:hypothetical protein